MPQSAVNAVIVDIMASANELPAKLISFHKVIPTTKKKIDIDEKSKSNL